MKTKIAQKSVLLLLHCLGIKRRFNSKEACSRYINKFGQLQLPSQRVPVLNAVKIASEIENIGMLKTVKLNSNIDYQRIVVYFHGGAFVEGIQKFHLSFCAKIARETNSCIIIPLYSRLPTGNASLALAEMIELMHRICDNESKPIVIMGDSAGAWLGLTLSQLVANLNVSLSQCILLSPWIDLKMHQNHAISDKSDVILSDIGLRYIASLYNPHDLGFKLGSKLNRLCSYHLYVSKNELFYSQVNSFEKIALNQQVDVEIVSYEGLFHDFMFFPFDESQDVLTRVIRSINAK